MPGQMRSVDAHRFAMTPRSDIQRSAFDVVHMHKTTFQAGYLIPMYVDEVLPGDTLRLKMHMLARGSTPLVPIMDNLILESFFFFVPTRLVWDNFQRFMGEMASPTDSTAFLMPQVTMTKLEISVASLLDYMGLTVNGADTDDIEVTSLPLRCYNLIWNEFFRDQDIQTKAPQNTDDGPDDVGDYVLLRRNKRADYFTTARPWPFKPLPGAQLFGSFDPLAYSGNFQRPAAGAPVTGLGMAVGQTPAAAGTVIESGARTVDFEHYYSTATLPFYMRAVGGSAGAPPDARVLIQDLRIANTVQQYLEKAARGGSRYTEIVRSLFGVISPDARLQRPEYLGGGRSFVSINPVTQTTPSGIEGTTTVLGEQAATAVLQAYSHGFSQSFTEHGYIIGLVNVRADLTYQQGIERLWNRRTMYDHYSPPFAHLGEQAIQRKEIYATGTAADDNTVFGYQERWAEYKYKASRTSGYFRSSVATPLDMWHMGQFFEAPPVLNGNFIQEDPPIARSMQVTDNWGMDFLADSMFEARWVRAMPMYSIPGLGGRL